MNETITCVFTDAGSPKTGLSAKISIWQVSNNALIIDDADMTEVAGGFYKYTFASFDKDQEYVIRCDGGSSLSNSDRYVYAASNKESMIEKLLRNKLVLSDGATNNWVLYDNDGATALLTFSVTDKNGAAITTDVSVPARRSRGV